MAPGVINAVLGNSIWLRVYGRFSKCSVSLAYQRLAMADAESLYSAP
jgi:hypothetical protein